MTAFWDTIKEDEREQEEITTYIIFCEDGYHEPVYFKSFELGNKLMINAIGRQGQRNRNFFNAVKKCNDDGLMEVEKGFYKVKKGITENIWCVYDRDENLNQPNVKDKEDFDFNSAIKNATDAGLKVAWSNDSFELWVLLHFEIIASGIKLYHDTIYDRLTEVFRNYPNQSNELTQITTVDVFRYEKHLKPKFSSIVLPILKERINVAVMASVSLEAKFSKNVLLSDRNPCTMVYHLVQELSAFHTE